MTANLELQRPNEWSGLRGFTNLYRKEHRAWWRTRRWWINALLWTAMLGGLTAIMLFASGEEVGDASAAEITQAGGLTTYILTLGLDMFFQFGVPMLAIGTVVLAQDLIIGEKQSGVAEWLLSKPVTRRAYILAKVAANSLGVLTLLIALPSVLAYGLLSLRLGALYPLLPFLSAVGIATVHTLFYLTLALMLGTIFNSRGPLLALALGSVLGGGIVGGLIEPLNYVTPWMLPNLARFTAAGQALPAGIGVAAPIATAMWSVIFVVLAIVKFEKMEC